MYLLFFPFSSSVLVVYQNPIEFVDSVEDLIGFMFEVLAGAVSGDYIIKYIHVIN